MLASMACRASYRPNCITARSDLSHKDMSPGAAIDRRFIGFQLGAASTVELPAPTAEDTRHYIETTVAGLSALGAALGAA